MTNSYNFRLFLCSADCAFCLVCSHSVSKLEASTAAVAKRCRCTETANELATLRARNVELERENAGLAAQNTANVALVAVRNEALARKIRTRFCKYISTHGAFSIGQWVLVVFCALGNLVVWNNISFVASS